VVAVLPVARGKIPLWAFNNTKYYSIIFDTTPDNAHVEQMSQFVRFVEIQRDSVEIREAFIDFIPLDVKTAEIITAEITKELERDGLNLEDCRVNRMTIKQQWLILILVFKSEF
jgi:hypothetical protein